MFSLEWGGGAGGAVQCISLYAKKYKIRSTNTCKFLLIL